MGQSSRGQKGKAADMSVAEVFRVYREVKKIQADAGITHPNPRDKDAIRRGLFGDVHGKSLSKIEKSRKASPSR